MTVEDRMREAAKKTKTEDAAQKKAIQELNKWVRDPDAKPRFKDPAQLVRK